MYADCVSIAACIIENLDYKINPIIYFCGPQYGFHEETKIAIYQIPVSDSDNL